MVREDADDSRSDGGGGEAEAERKQTESKRLREEIEWARSLGMHNTVEKLIAKLVEL